MLVEMAEMIAIYWGGTKETLEKCGNEANQIGWEVHQGSSYVVWRFKAPSSLSSVFGYWWYLAITFAASFQCQVSVISVLPACHDYQYQISSSACVPGTELELINEWIVEGMNGITREARMRKVRGDQQIYRWPSGSYGGSRVNLIVGRQYRRLLIT